jgi:hypothetical protein
MTTHIVRTTFSTEWTNGDKRGWWECDCGRSGSAPEYRVDEASDKHIDYDAGDKRVDRHPG